MVRLRLKIRDSDYDVSKDEKAKGFVADFVSSRDDYQKLVREVRRAGSKEQWKILSKLSSENQSLLFEKEKEFGILEGNLRNGGETSLRTRNGSMVSGTDVLNVWRDYFS